MRTTWPVSLKIPSGNHNAMVIRRLRASNNLPVGQINTALLQGKPIPVCALFGLSHDEDERNLLALLDDLAAVGLEPDIYVSGKIESKQYLFNILQSHREIAYDTEMEIQLEIGEPSEEAKAWESGNFQYPKTNG